MHHGKRQQHIVRPSKRKLKMEKGKKKPKIRKMMRLTRSFLKKKNMLEV